ncbi:precorrin-6y C5,15-methyltransferase (decarboxylating) subunit CbiE [Breoghania sp. L-A4]|uniref:precorrin-6y C5,15-methyltransferase (decarboxylating) subunit CbiE n=1 Tax=Breoghania sp. L-A4 TaxID=2304600 RepID=UPI000E35DDE6|nr:precorrin-6y C5,15-methyltransferase (decarboxylating) subunit CbiE [Breoghania sp. L-A4]AXS39126.1 precorrin-6y C5,15-methyltransferase (decarboxylating) subunit CbiE [Breoghania sp. L-A4]
MTPWLTLVGIAEDGFLSDAARAALEAAEVVYGGARHFEIVENLGGKQKTWPSPFSAVYEELDALRGRPVAVLATGDPQWYGIGATLARHFDAGEMRVLPAPSAFQLAAARLRWPLQDVETISLHGRPVETLRGFLAPGVRIIALTSNGDTVREVADILTADGYGGSRLVALEHMGGDRERIVEATARAWRETIADFNTLAIDCLADPGLAVRPRVPGLPDEAFRHDGKMTKREVRAVTLARLQPVPGALLWDIGAGCGSVAIEWMRAARNAHAVAIEPLAERRAMMAENALALGVPGLEIREGAAPDALDSLPAPDAIFIGGGLTAEGVFEAAWAALKPGGRLVANAVTLESEARLLALHRRHGGALTRIAISRASPVGGLTGWRPMMPVTQWAITKEHAA